MVTGYRNTSKRTIATRGQTSAEADPSRQLRDEEDAGDNNLADADVDPEGAGGEEPDEEDEEEDDHRPAPPRRTHAGPFPAPEDTVVGTLPADATAEQGMVMPARPAALPKLSIESSQTARGSPALLHEARLEALQRLDTSDMSAAQLEEHVKKIELMEKLINGIKRKRADSQASLTPSVASSDYKRSRSPVDDFARAIGRKDPPSLKTASQAAYQVWVEMCENSFSVMGLEHHDHERRSRWIFGGIAAELKDVRSAVQRRLNDTKNPSSLYGDLRWIEFKQVVQDSIKSPAVRRGDLACQYWNATFRGNQTVLNFFNYLQGLEDIMEAPMKECQTKVDFYYAKLPSYVRDEFVRTDTLKRTRTTRELIDSAQHYEQALRANQAAPSKTTTGAAPSSGGNRNRGAAPGGYRGGRASRHRGNNRGQDVNYTPVPPREKPSENSPP